MPRMKGSKRCRKCWHFHNGRKSLCAFCEEELLGAAVEPEPVANPNTPQANRFQVALARAGKLVPRAGRGATAT
jgi:hypothetical protein